MPVMDKSSITCVQVSVLYIWVPVVGLQTNSTLGEVIQVFVAFSDPYLTLLTIIRPYLGLLTLIWPYLAQIRVNKPK